MPSDSTVLSIFTQCVQAIRDSVFIHRQSRQDKEFHFQNWVSERLQETGLYYEAGGRNSYPDFRMVNSTEGYEVKGLAYPGREDNYDCNSQVPSGLHNGRTIFYVFGRYPAEPDDDSYPVLDLVVCHGDFLNADHDYIHKNRHIKGFGTYGDVMVRDRKMYVAPTPFGLLSGVAHIQTLILPEGFLETSALQRVGHLVRKEATTLVVGYKFDLRTNDLVLETIPNPSAGQSTLLKPGDLAPRWAPSLPFERCPCRMIPSPCGQRQFPLLNGLRATDMQIRLSQRRLIEADAFPFEFLSAVAERESWRKEIYRPIYHIHKWWAKRLGSIFRGILLGCLLPEGENLQEVFYKRHRFEQISAFDPFMGSGTTIGEAHKLGCSALGRDINPVACEVVRIALGPLSRAALQDTYTWLSDTVGAKIRSLYKTSDEKGVPCDVLYYFWVKWISCPNCNSAVDLFPSRIFARNAYPGRKPDVRICCPGCGGVFSAHNGKAEVVCPHCDMRFDPHSGPASGVSATCPVCMRSFSIVEAVRRAECPPHHRLYAKLLLTPDDHKCYLPATSQDIRDYEACQLVLTEEITRGAIRLPSLMLADGYNTRQAMNYGYRCWRDFFNARQLLALGWLQQAIADLPDPTTRDAFLVLFSGILEFNNLFASYKGEGTGAVRHMFAHHILKPERTPIEANVWGTPKSSGSFSNLFKSRLLRAVDYRDAPFEAATEGSGKRYGAAEPFSGQVKVSWPTEEKIRGRSIYLSCGSSDVTGLPDQSIDLIVTDPPFFDNVHYSELADFFFAWQSLYPRGFIRNATTTRHEREVQDGNPDRFAQKLCAVFTECTRILQDDGLLVFTYHHSRYEGWLSLVHAIYGAGFTVVNAHPVRAEMTVAAPKAQAKEPIQLDMVLVCRKKTADARIHGGTNGIAQEAAMRADQKLARLKAIGLTLSRNDRRIVYMGQFMAGLGPMTSPEAAMNALLAQESTFETLADSSATAITAPCAWDPPDPVLRPQQYAFWDTQTLSGDLMEQIS